MEAAEKTPDSVDRIFSLITTDEDITWQSLLYDLVRKEGMDPWNIDVSQISKRYLEMVKKLQKHDFRVSGKVLLAAAILLKIKSHYLVDEEIGELDRLIAGPPEEGSEDLLFEEAEDEFAQEREDAKDAQLIPRTPQPRKRKVSIYDLVGALEQALEVKKRRVLNSMPPETVEPPKKTKDITEVIRDVYGRIMNHFTKSKAKSMTFTQLIPSEERDDKIQTFVPLLHLSQQRKLDLGQEEPFGEIEVMLASKKEADEELEDES